ncbi:TraR/DksA C4-type zinc finger protein [Hafnia alvei]|uniref:TraR/DksA C4-type zinc finger protein n=1 Tax=Hafnia alvei TaxID=569 RepID=UPI001E57EAA6|nr:TraR/DksA C4-type zinc finger protein [Hafnia alvei]MDU7483589.1 TraR/DksA C4-type zinc finger protein [Hafnia alvei]
MEFLNQFQFTRTYSLHRPSATHCCDCHAPIPELRRKTLVGVQRCVDCQSILELISQ